MNYYDVLRINKNASSQEIKDSYKKLIKRYHPDLYPGNKVRAEAITRDLNEAYEVLSDPQKREMYDLSLERTITQEDNPKQTYTYTTSQEYKTETSEKENSINFQEKLKENIHTFVDKQSQQMTQNTKKTITLIIIFFALFILLLTAKDYLDFQFSIQEKYKKQELKSIQNNIDNDEFYIDDEILEQKLKQKEL